MKPATTVVSLLCVILASCGTNTRVPSMPAQSRSEPVVIETPEIVRILENERITGIYTTHQQLISISLKDGRTFQGTYEHAEAGPYSQDNQLADILNLVSHIKKKRPAKETKEWFIVCE